MKETLLLRLMGKVAIRQDGCWEWTGPRNKKGYGQAWDGKRNRHAHRVIWEELHGPLANGLELDHLCRNRGCCNPLHLEPVTHAENIKRGSRANQTHCKRGHPLSGIGADVYFFKGGGKQSPFRKCRVCERENYRRKREKLSA